MRWSSWAWGPLCVGLVACSPSSGAILQFEPTTFASETGAPVRGELGFLDVPENYDRPGTPRVRLAIGRFASRSGATTDPILYLAGGPGAWGLHPERMPLLDSLRALGDVYTLDQRGTGRSTPVLDCPNTSALPAGSAPSRAELLEMFKRQARQCAAFWRGEGWDLSSFNTVMSAHDLDVLRQALGAERFRIVAPSYGSHLALAYIRLYEPRVARAVLALVEGPDHTVKLPSNVDRHLKVVSEFIAHDRTAGHLLPNLHDLVVTTLGRLEQSPARVQAPTAGGDSASYMLTATDFRRIVAGMIGRRFSIQFIPQDFAPVQRGEFSQFAPIFPAFRRASENAMRAAMDRASSASNERSQRIAIERATSLLGTMADFPYPEVCEAWGVTKLDAEFRRPVHSSVPVLFLSGGLDGRTPISNAEEVREGFAISSHIVVGGVGHEGLIFWSAPEVLPLVAEFLEGGLPASQRLDATPIAFSIPQDGQ